MNVQEWSVNVRGISVRTSAKEFTVPRSTILRWTKDLPGEYQSGCIVTVVCTDGNLQFTFPDGEAAQEFKNAMDEYLT